MVAFLKSYVTLIVAVVAFIQPWVRALWKRYFRQGEIEIYEIASLEIGYSGLGPTIGVTGTLRCINRDLFVQAIKLELIKQRDFSKHVFEWAIFRSEKITFGGKPESSFELPYAFLLTTSSPRRFNIQFHDTQIQSEIRQIINKVSQEWAKVVTELGKGDLLHLLSHNVILPSELQDRYQALYERFSNSKIHVQSHTSLDRMCYWEAGKYTLKIVVQTSRPDKSFEKSWSFTLTEPEEETIRLNVIKVLQDTCGHPSIMPQYSMVSYFFAYPKYEPKRSMSSSNTGENVEMQ